MEIEEEVDNLMSNDIMSAVMSTKTITFTRAQSGWIFKEDKHVRCTVSFSCSCIRWNSCFQSNLFYRKWLVHSIRIIIS